MSGTEALPTGELLVAGVRRRPRRSMPARVVHAVADELAEDARAAACRSGHRERGCCGPDRRREARRRVGWTQVVDHRRQAAAPVWDGRDAWVAAVALAAQGPWRRPLSRAGVDPDTFVRWAGAEADHADYRTGRGARAEVAHVAVVVGCSERTVYRCRSVARSLGLIVRVATGRLLRWAERSQVLDAGGRQRGLTSVHCLTVPPSLRPYVDRLRRLRRQSSVSPGQGGVGDNVTQPVGSYLTGEGFSSVGQTIAPARRAKAGAARRRGPTTGKGRPRAGDRLAAEWLRTVPWGHRCHPRRVGPLLAAAERHGVTPAELNRAMDAALRAAGVEPPRSPRTPWAWVAWVMARVDVADVAARRSARRLAVLPPPPTAEELREASEEERRAAIARWAPAVKRQNRERRPAREPRPGSPEWAAARARARAVPALVGASGGSGAGAGAPECPPVVPGRL